VRAGNGVTVTVDAQNNSGPGLAAAARGPKALGDAAEVANRQLRSMEGTLDAANIKARRLAEAEERAAAKARDMAMQLAGLKRQLSESGDESGVLGRKIDRLTIDTRSAALATDDYRRAAERAAENARDQARAYDRVAANAREAARAVTLFGAASRLGGGGGAGGAAGGLFGNLNDISSGFFRGGLRGGGAAIEGALGTPILGPALVAGGAAAAVPAATFAGAAAGGGILAGGGLAAAGGGLAGAWMGDPEKYGAQWNGMIDRVQKRWIDSSRAFGDELDEGLQIADQTLRRLPVERILAASQSFTTPIATGAGQGISAAAEGFADALEKIQPIIDEIGPAIGNLGNDVGDAFRMISEGSEGGAHALGDLINVIGYAVQATGLLILGFEKAYETARDFGIGVRDAIRQSDYGPAFEGLTTMLFDIRESSIQIGRTLDDTGRASSGLGESWADMARAGAEAAIETLNLNDALTELRNTQLAMADANLAVAQGWLDLKEGLEDGAKTLDTTTQAGIDNNRVIQDQVALLERQRQQAIETGGGTVEAVDAANAAYNAQIEKLRAAAYAAGYNKEKVDELIASLGNVPATTTATVSTPGLAESLRQGESLRQRLDQIDGRHAEATVTVYYRSQGQSLNAGLRTGGIKGAATGGPQSGLTEVGEEGPELLRLPTGSMVFPKANRNQMMAMAGGGPGTGGKPFVIELRATGSGGLYEIINAGLRSGDIQVPETAVLQGR
jgi:hypothetical protein